MEVINLAIVSLIGYTSSSGGYSSFRKSKGKGKIAAGVILLIIGVLLFQFLIPTMAITPDEYWDDVSDGDPYGTWTVHGHLANKDEIPGGDMTIYFYSFEENEEANFSSSEDLGDNGDEVIVEIVCSEETLIPTAKGTWNPWLFKGPGILFMLIGVILLVVGAVQISKTITPSAAKSKGYGTSYSSAIPMSLAQKLKKGVVGPIIAFIVVLLLVVGPFINVHIPWLYASLGPADSDAEGNLTIGMGVDSKHVWLADSQVGAIKVGDEGVEDADYDDDIKAVYDRVTVLLAIGLVLTLIGIILAVLALKGKIYANNAMYVSIIGGIIILLAPIYFVIGMAGATELSAAEVIYDSEEFEGLKFTSNVSWAWILSLAMGIVNIACGAYMRDPTGATKKKKKEEEAPSSGMDVSKLFAPPAASPMQQPLTMPQQHIPQQPPMMPMQPPSQFLPQQAPPTQPMPPGFQALGPQPRPQIPQLQPQQPSPQPRFPPTPAQTPPMTQQPQPPPTQQPQVQLPQPTPEPPVTPEYQAPFWTCPNCGNSIESKYIFCTSCGHRKGG